VYGRVDPTDDREPMTGPLTTGTVNTGRHRGRRPMPAPLALALTVTALLTMFGAATALLPGSFTGTGAAAQTPAGVIADLAPEAGGGTDTGSAPTGDPSSTPTSAPPTATVPKTRTTKPEVTKPKATRPTAAKPKVTKSKASAPAVGEGQVAQENEVIRLTNVERAKKGCGKVKLNTKLRTAIRGHTQDMANKNYFSHDSQDGRSPWDRAKSAGYQTPIGENIAKGQRDAAEVMRGWMNSPGHKANILNCDAKAIGVGLSYDGGTAIWGQLFGSV
jgi:uncharacterized protein YkwD